jgi:hypothetical protein
LPPHVDDPSGQHWLPLHVPLQQAPPHSTCPAPQHCPLPPAHVWPGRQKLAPQGVLPMGAHCVPMHVEPAEGRAR